MKVEIRTTNSTHVSYPGEFDSYQYQILDVDYNENQDCMGYKFPESGNLSSIWLYNKYDIIT